MAPSLDPATQSPSTRASLARKSLNRLPDNEIVYVDRLGPRILRVPPDPIVCLSRDTLRELDKGNLTGRLAQGARFLTNRMLQCPEITVDTNGHYTVQKKKNNPNGKNSRAYTVKTLDIWTGKPGELHEDREIVNLIFYSVGADLLPSYHSWRNDKLERRESSLELERQQEADMAEQKFTARPKPIADVIDEYKAEKEAKLDEDASNDPENMLRFKPNIRPSDPAWEGVEEYFKWILQYEREESRDAPKVYRVLRDELLESQLLLAIPAINGGYRAKIQDENTTKYYEALRTAFRGKPDNLVTKLTMLCFGLPIAPLTLANVKFAGGLEDVPADGEDVERGLDGEIIERTVWSEKPLEFLDYYNERSYGYPMVRTQKRKYEQMDTEAVEKLLAQYEERAKHPRIVRDGCGFHDIDKQEQGLHLRGGAGDPVGGQFRKLWLYTELGRFYVDDEFETIRVLVYRLLRLEERSANKSWEWCQWDLIPVVHTNSGVEVNKAKRPGRYMWLRGHTTDNQPKRYERFIGPQRKANDRWIFRLRLFDEITNYEKKKKMPRLLDWRDPWEPANDRNLVNLNVRGVGIAYWYLPGKKPHLNVLQDTFRNAIECLVPQHRKYRVQWDIQGNPESSGQLQLIVEAPSEELWDATQRALGSQPHVTIYITVLEDRKPDPLAVKILMPGFKSMGWYNRLPDADLGQQNPVIFQAIRNFAQKRTEPSRTALRIWSGVENYDNDGDLERRLSMVLPVKPNPELEFDIWQIEGLAYAWDAVLVRPEFEDYNFVCMMDQTMADMSYNNCPSETLGACQGHITLRRFRTVVGRLLVDFNPKEDYIVIEQRQSEQTFIIGPEMTEVQWRTQVFDWFDCPTILFRRHERWAPMYAKDVIDGPLGPTFNSTSAEKTPDPTDRGEEPEGPLDESVPLDTAQQDDTGLITGTVTIESPTGVITRPETTESGTTEQGIIPAVDPPAEDDPLSKRLPDATKERWAAYRKEQMVEEQRRLEAYTQNESIHQDGQNPRIPKFGPPIEGNIPAAGVRFPIIYTGMSTATENVERDREARELLNVVLERQDFCGVCEKTLPAGAHNFEVRKRHYQEHRDIIREAQRNAFGNFATVAQGLVPDVSYCEYCGKTPAEFEKENSGQKHGPTCASKAAFNDIPQFCQYCRLNFWDNSMMNETIGTHVQNCAYDRRVSPQAQINLYQQLLSRAVGRGQPSGESKCHFNGCEQIFNSATTNLAKALHFLCHLDRHDKEKLYCIYPNCRSEFTDVTQEQVVAHLSGHFGSGNDGRNSISNFCPIEGCYCDFNHWTQEQIEAHLLYHIRPGCPWLSCGHCFESNATEHDREQHLIHEHMMWCQWEGCSERYGEQHNNDAVKEHYRAHVRAESVPTGNQPNRSPCTYMPLSCPMPDCGHIFATGAAEDDKTAHLRTHMSLRCPIPRCNYIFAPDATNDDRWTHMHDHCLRDCIWPGCRYTFVQVPTGEELTEHMRSHGLVRVGLNAPAGPLRILGQGTEGPGTPRPGPPGNNTAATEIDDNNIPQQLKDAYPGMNFYCPVCLMLVSGKNTSPCKRHRRGNCNVQGHTSWLILTANQRKDMKNAAKVQKGKKKAPKRKDSVYKPPTGEEPGDNDGDGAGNADSPVLPGPRRSGRKRPADGRPGDDAGDGAGPSKTKRKK